MELHELCNQCGTDFEPVLETPDGLDGARCPNCGAVIRARHAALGPAELERLRAQLEAERARLTGVLEQDAADAWALGEDTATEGVFSSHPADIATAVQQQAEIEVEGSHLQRELLLVQSALNRLKAGTYGLCRDCHRPIPVERLTVLPAAERDVACQERHERSLPAR